MKKFVSLIKATMFRDSTFSKSSLSIWNETNKLTSDGSIDVAYPSRSLSGSCCGLIDFWCSLPSVAVWHHSRLWVTVAVWIIVSRLLAIHTTHNKVNEKCICNHHLNEITTAVVQIETLIHVSNVYVVHEINKYLIRCEIAINSKSVVEMLWGRSASSLSSSSSSTTNIRNQA